MKLILKAITLSIMLLSIHPAYAQDFWEEIDFPFDTDIHCIAVNAQGHIFIGTGSNGGENVGLFRSMDNGETWEKVFDIPNHPVYSVAITKSGAIYIGTVGTHYLRVSYDNGNTWEGLNFQFTSSGNITTIYPYGTDTLYIGTGPGNGTAEFARTYDGGQTFIVDTVMTDNQYIGYVSGIKKMSNGDICVSVSGFFYGEGGVYKSSNEGETWEYLGLMDHQVTAIGVNSNDEIFTGDWGEMNLQNIGEYALYEGSNEFEYIYYNDGTKAMAITSGGDIYISGGNYFSIEGTILSTDNGQSFVEIDTIFPDTGMKLCIAENGRLYGARKSHIGRSIEAVDYLIVISNQPDNQFEVCPNAVLNYAITGDFIDYYQWQKSVDSGVIWNDILDNEYYTGTQSDTLWVTANLETGNALYRCKVWDEYDTLYSLSAQLLLETQAPQIECPENQQVNADETHTYTVQGTEFDPISLTDNCELANLSNNINGEETLLGAILSEGNNTIIWTAADSANNIAECSFTVFVTPYVGIDENQNYAILISPNPTRDKLYFKSKMKIEKINIYELTGKKIRDIELKKDNSINISDFNKGIYLIEIQTDMQVYFKKIVKQ